MTVLANPSLRDLIIEKAKAFNLPIEIVAGLVHQESSGNPNATRFEPEFFEKYVKNKDVFNLAKANGIEPKLLATSIGLTQVMGLTAYQMTGNINIVPKLFDPKINLEIGLRYFKREFDALKSFVLAYAAYNSGPRYPREILSIVKNDLVLAENMFFDVSSPIYNSYKAKKVRLFIEKVKIEQEFLKTIIDIMKNEKKEVITTNTNIDNNNNQRNDVNINVNVEHLINRLGNLKVM